MGDKLCRDENTVAFDDFKNTPAFDGFSPVMILILNCLAKWLSVRLRTKWLWVRVPLQSPV